MSTRVSTPLVRAPGRSPSWLRPARTPEPSRSAQPRRPTCRAPDLDGSGPTPGHNGRRRTARAGLNAIHPCFQPTFAALERSPAGWRGRAHYQCKCVNTSTDPIDSRVTATRRDVLGPTGGAAVIGTQSSLGRTERPGPSALPGVRFPRDHVARRRRTRGVLNDQSISSSRLVPGPDIPGSPSVVGRRRLVRAHTSDRHLAPTTEFSSPPAPPSTCHRLGTSCANGSR
jgi:hypothetical protein